MRGFSGANRRSGSSPGRSYSPTALPFQKGWGAGARTGRQVPGLRQGPLGGAGRPPQERPRAARAGAPGPGAAGGMLSPRHGHPPAGRGAARRDPAPPGAPRPGLSDRAASGPGDTRGAAGLPAPSLLLFPPRTAGRTHKKKVVQGLPAPAGSRPARALLTGVEVGHGRLVLGSHPHAAATCGEAEHRVSGRGAARGGRGRGWRHLPCSSSLDEPELPSSQELLLLLPLGATAAKLLFCPLLGAAAAEAAEEAAAAAAAETAAAEAAEAGAAEAAALAALFLPLRFPDTSGPFSTMVGISGGPGRARVTGTPAPEEGAPGRDGGVRRARGRAGAAGAGGGPGGRSAGRFKPPAPSRAQLSLSSPPALHWLQLLREQRAGGRGGAGPGRGGKPPAA